MRVRIKFCGMTRREDLEAAAEMGADAVGLVFVRGTPRNVEPDLARDLIRGLPPFLVRVGVFADEEPERVRSIREELALGIVQLHGGEPPEVCEAVGGPLIKTFQVDRGWDPTVLDRYSCGACLLEARRSGSTIGERMAFDWGTLRGRLADRRIILAGGLTSRNVAEAIRAVRPYAVDVSSGIESAPGIKDHGRMHAFVEAVRRGER